LNRRKRLINSYYRNTIAISIEFPLPVFTITFPLLSVPYWYLYLTRLLYPSLRLVFRYLLYFPSSNPETKVLVLVSNPVCNCLMVSIDFSRLIDFVIRLGLFGSFCKAIVVSAIWSLSPPLLPIKSIVASSWLEYPVIGATAFKLARRSLRFCLSFLARPYLSVFKLLVEIILLFNSRNKVYYASFERSWCSVWIWWITHFLYCWFTWWE
jgi:hypothetical protein